MSLVPITRYRWSAIWIAAMGILAVAIEIARGCS